VVAIIANEAVMVPMVGSVGVCVRRVWNQAVGFVLVYLAGIWLQSP
jgi:hypothetical protein